MTTQQSDAPRVLCEVRRQAPTPPPVEAIVLTLPPDVAVTLRHLTCRVLGDPATTYARHVYIIYRELADALDDAGVPSSSRFTGGCTNALPLPPEPAR